MPRAAISSPTAERAPAVTQRIHARIFWMKDRPLERGQTYLFKLATSTATARVEAGLSVVDLDTRRAVAADAIGPNEVGHCTLTFDRAGRAGPLRRLQGYRKLYSHRSRKLRHGGNGLRRGDCPVATLIVAWDAILAFAGEILRHAGMRHLGAPRRLRRVAAAADEARHAGGDHRADAHDVAVASSADSASFCEPPRQASTRTTSASRPAASTPLLSR